LYQRKFKLWAFEEVLLIHKGHLGLEIILLQWHKLQAIEIKQSFYQRQHQLATVIIHTASGEITVPFIPLLSAQQLINYALYKTETSFKKWM
jgi:putative membrane protein